MDMIERVARAIAQADEQNGGPPYDYRVTMSKHAREQLFDQARAAIAAVRSSITPEFALEVMTPGSSYLNWVKEPGNCEEWYGNFEDFQDGWNVAFAGSLNKKTPAG